MKRRTFFFAGGGLVAIFLLLAALMVAIVYGWQRDWLRREFETRLTEALHTPVSIGSIEGPLHRGVTLHALRIGESSTPLLEMDALRLQLDTLQLTGTPTLVISQIDLHRPQLHLRRGIDGRWPWDAAEEESAEADGSWPFVVVVDSVNVDAGVVENTDGAETLLRMELDGSLEDARVGAALAEGKLRFSFAVSRSAASGESAIAGSLEASYTDGRLESVALRAEGPGFDAQARGSGTLEEIERAEIFVRIASIDAFDELLLGDVLAVSGSVSVSADLRGALRWPTGTLVVDAANIHTADLQLGAVRLEAVSEQAGTLRVDGLRLESGSLELTAEPGALIIADQNQTALHGLELHESGGESALKIDLETSPDLSRGFDALLHDEATRVAIEAKAWPLGTLAPLWRLAGVEVSGLLDADLTLTGAEPEPQIHGLAQLESGEIRVSDAEAVGVQLKIEVDGPLSAPPGRFAATAEAIRWADTPLGALRVVVEVPSVRAAVIEEFVLSGGPLALRVGPGSRLRAERAGLAIEDFDLIVEDQQLLVSGWVSRSDAKELRVEFSGLDAVRLAQMASARGESSASLEIAGRVGGHLQWDGPIVDPTLTGKLRWSDARLGDLVFERIEAGVDTNQGVVKVDSRWTYEGKAALDADASLPADRILTDPASLLDDPRMSLHIRADGFELATLARFLPPAVTGLAGSLTADLRATGGQIPAGVSGKLAIDQGSATLRALGGQRLSPIFARASLAGEHIRLDEFQIGEENSRVYGGGKLRLSEGRPRAIDLRLVFENFAIDAPGLVKGRLDGPVELTGTADAPVLQGSLELAGLRAQIPESKSVEVKEIRVFSGDGDDTDTVLREGVSRTTLLDLLRLNLDIAVRRNSWARGRGAEVEFQGDLEAKKDPRQPLSLSGSFETVRGTYEIYGRRFRIDRGEAVLDGATEVDPVLDVRAEHKVRDVRIIALLEGRLSEPTLRFESEPELSETDIASYLFFGRPAGDVGGGQQPALDSAAAQIAAGAALSELERVFGGALPVDMLDARMEGEGEESEVRVGVGKYIGERLFLHYERGFGNEAEDELRAEYELTPHWSVESTVSTDNQVGADLFFEAEH